MRSGSETKDRHTFPGFPSHASRLASGPLSRDWNRSKTQELSCMEPEKETVYIWSQQPKAAQPWVARNYEVVHTLHTTPLQLRKAAV